MQLTAALTLARRRARARGAVQHRPGPAPAPPRPAPPHAPRRIDPPQDAALYSCPCGFAWNGAVTTSIGCPHCGTAQAW